MEEIIYRCDVCNCRLNKSNRFKPKSKRIIGIIIKFILDIDDNQLIYDCLCKKCYIILKEAIKTAQKTPNMQKEGK